MKVLDPGHYYELATLDPAIMVPEIHLRFVKRLGPNFPGNRDAYPGTTLQEVLRACCERLRYVGQQGHELNQPIQACQYSAEALGHLRAAILCLERRAALMHHRDPLDIGLDMAETGTCCAKCNHVGCQGLCHD